MFKFLVLAAAMAVVSVNAGYLGGYAAPAYGYAAHGPAAITSQSSNILRTPGNLGQVSTYSKTIDTPYSSVSKSDVRVSNPGYATYAAPAYASHAYAAPAYASHAYAAPAYASHAYAAPAYASHAYAAPLSHAAYAAPVAHAAYAHAPVVAKAYAPAGLGVAYSAAPAVAHLSFDGYGVHYGY